MIFYNYMTNIFSTNKEFKQPIVLFAVNKKEALKFAKQFKGMIIGDKLKNRKQSDYDSDYMMKAQADAFIKLLNENKVYIKNE